MLPVDGTVPTSKLPVCESTTQQSTECGVLVQNDLVFTISTWFGFAAGHFCPASKTIPKNKYAYTCYVDA
jgi:peroxiredoxin